MLTNLFHSTLHTKNFTPLKASFITMESGYMLVIRTGKIMPKYIKTQVRIKLKQILTYCYNLKWFPKRKKENNMLFIKHNKHNIRMNRDS